MATVVKTIGVSGDYPDVASWAADLTNASIYTAGDEAIGKIVDREAICALTFPSSVLPSVAHLTADDSVRHTGRPGTGCRLLPRSNASAIYAPWINYKVIVSNLEVDYELTYNTGPNGGIVFQNAAQGGSIEILNVIIWRVALGSGSNNYGINCNGYANGPCKIENTIVLSVRRNTSFGTCAGIFTNSWNTSISNCLVVDNKNIYFGAGVGVIATTQTTIKNCVSLNNGVDFSGTANASSSNNASTDATAPGSASLLNLTDYENLLSPYSGDPSFKLGSSLIGAGVAIGGLTTDIAGNEYNDPPSIGPLEYTVTGGSTLHPLYATGRK